MSSSFPLFPPNASSVATEVDLLYLFITSVCAFFTVLVTALVVVFTIKYRRRHPDEVGHDIHGSLALELTWTIIPLILSMVMFGWGADLFYRLAKPPRDSMEIFVVGKQWMWKVQHPDGVARDQRAPRADRPQHPADDGLGGRAARLLDPRVPREDGRRPRQAHDDVVPGDEAGHVPPVLCRILRDEALGDDRPGHRDDAAGLRSMAGRRPSAMGSPAQNGERLFAEHACVTCHKQDSTGRGPTLYGLYGSKVALADGRTVIADENYLRESIMNSQAKVVQGHQPIMPAFQGMLTEENLMQLIAYIKTLKPVAPAGK